MGSFIKFDGKYLHLVESRNCRCDSFLNTNRANFNDEIGTSGFNVKCLTFN